MDISLYQFGFCSQKINSDQIYTVEKKKKLAHAGQNYLKVTIIIIIEWLRLDGTII